MGSFNKARRVRIAAAMAFMLMAATVGRVPPIGGDSQAAAQALAPDCANHDIGGSIYTGGTTTPVEDASVMVQNQHDGGAFITYGTVSGNSWTAEIDETSYPDVVVMFSAPGHDVTSREFTWVGTAYTHTVPGQAALGDNCQDAYLPPFDAVTGELPTANLLFYVFYDNYVNGEDDAPDDPAMNGVWVTATDSNGFEHKGLTGSQPAPMNLSDGTVLSNTDGFYYFTDLPPGEVIVTSDPSEASNYSQPDDPVTSLPLGAAWTASTEFYLMTSEEGGPSWEINLYPGDPGTEVGAYIAWHGYVEKLGQIGDSTNPTEFDPTIAGTVSGILIDADSAGLDPAEPWPVPGEDHPGVTLNSTVPDSFLVLYSNDETTPVHPVATAEGSPADETDPRFPHEVYEFTNVPPGAYKIFTSDVPIDYVWNQAQVRVTPGGNVTIDPLVPRFFARARGYVFDDSTGTPTAMAGATVNLRYKSGAIKETAVTDSTGWYNFDSLPEIEVLGFVDVELPPDFRGAMKTQTFYPRGKEPGDRYLNGVDGAENATYSELSVEFNAMNRYIQWYTANYRADFHLEKVPVDVGEISGIVWSENLEPGTWLPDGSYDPKTERTLHGVTVELTYPDSSVDTTTTGIVNLSDLEAQGWIPPYTRHLDEAGGVFVGDMPGFYEFRDLAPGEYTVRLIPPAGYSPSPPGSDTTTVTVVSGDRIDQNFGANTRVPQAGEIEGGVFDDINVDNNPNSLLQFEKAGVPGAPVGVYDHLGYFLGWAKMGDPLCFEWSWPPENPDVPDPNHDTCPLDVPQIQKPEMERRFAPGVHIYVGNDPSLPGHDTDYLPMGLSYSFEQGQYKFEADWSLLPTSGAVFGGDGALVAANRPTISSVTPPGSVVAGSDLTITGTNFGPTKDGGTVALAGKKLEVLTWTDTEILVSVPPDAGSGPLLVTNTAGTSNGLLVSVIPLAGLGVASLKAAAASGGAVYVDASADPEVADGSASHPWRTVSDALAHLPVLAPGTPRDVIVAAGTYNEQVHIVESDVRIIGAGPDETTVDGTSAVTVNQQGIPHGGGPVFYIGQGPITGAVENITISGFTITGGSVADEIGSGIFAGLNNRGIDINNNRIVHNGGYYGGGIWFHYSVHDVLIWSNTIAENGNMGGYGGGISVNDEPEDPNTPEHSQPEHTVDDALDASPPGTYEIYNNLIFRNLSADSGGGITLYEVKDRLEVHDNMILENVAQDHGGGMFVEDSGPIRVYGNVFLRNVSPDDGGALSFEDVADGTTVGQPTPVLGALSHQVEVYDNLFAENIADDHGENYARGGAIALDDTLDAEIHHNTIVGNIVAGSETPAGGGIDSERNGHEYNGESAPWIAPGFSDPLVHDNIIWDNWRLMYDQPNEGTEEDLDRTWGENFRWTPDQIHVDNPTLQQQWETATNSFSLSHVNNNVIRCGYPSGSGNIDADPLFVDSAAFDWQVSDGSLAVGFGFDTSDYPVIPIDLLGFVDIPVRDPNLTAGCPPFLAIPSALLGGTLAGALSEVTAIPGDHHVLVSWIAQTPTGASAITGYTVSAEPGTAGCVTASALTLSCDIPGLTNFESYVFTVVANSADSNQLVGTATAMPAGSTCDSAPDMLFDDIDGSFASASIACIFHLDITTGTSDTTYSPHGVVKRDQMAAFLARLWRSLSLVSSGTGSPFTDIDGNFAAGDIGFIFNLEITTGTSDTTYSPRNAVTREQAAWFLARTWRGLGGYCDWSATSFVDVVGIPAAPDIACLYNLGITTGTSSTTYSPSNIVSREQMAAFIARLWQTATNWGL